MKLNKNIVIVSLIIIALTSWAVYKLSSNKKMVEERVYIPDLKVPVLVSTCLLTSHTFQSEFNYLGTFEPFRQNIIGSEGGGRVVAIQFQEGSVVSQGSIMAKLDDELLRLQLENLEVSIEGQKKDDQRYTTLSGQNAAPEVQAEKVKLGIRSSEIQKRQIQKQLKGTQITAPYSGVVTKKLIDLGSVIGAGSPVAEITDISSLKLSISVPERDIMKFKLNQSVSISVDVLDNVTYQGKVSTISVQADKAHNFKVQILVPNKKMEMRSGMYGSVSFDNNQKVTAFSVPRKALVGSMKSPQVYVVKDGIAKLISFTAGTSDGDFIEVISGIESTDQVITKGLINLKNNSNVKINN